MSDDDDKYLQNMAGFRPAAPVMELTEDLAGELAGPVAEISALPGQLTAVTFSLDIRGRQFDLLYMPANAEAWVASTVNVRSGVVLPDDEIERFGDTALEALQRCVAAAQAALEMPAPAAGLTRCERGECVDCRPVAYQARP